MASAKQIKARKAFAKKYAKKGKEKYFRYFDSTIVGNYIISKSFDIDIKKPDREGKGYK